MTTQTATREHPILFSSEMIRAILTGRKTMTRRIVKPQPKHQPTLLEHADRHRWSDGFDFIRECPYGQPRDRLWCRETFAIAIPAGASIHADRVPCYKADGDVMPRWTPSIFMPHDASRITLEITGVRVERLQQITEEDAIAEGCTTRTYRDGRGHESARHDFRCLWDSLNAKKAPWVSNPWVWAIEFRRIKP